MNYIITSDFLFLTCLSFIKEIIPLDKMFVDTVDFYLFIKHYEPTPLRWLIIDTLGHVTIISYSVVCTEEAISKTLESIAGNPAEVELFKEDLKNFCIENGFDINSSVLKRIFKAISFLAKLKKPDFDYNKRLVFVERKKKAIFFIKHIKRISHIITVLIYTDREVIKKDEQKFKFFRFILLKNIKKDYTTSILYENNFYKFYKGWFS